MKKALLILAFLSYGIVNAQSTVKQDLGINLAGVFIKKQASVAPALFYRYSIKKNYQLRLQLAMDGSLTSKNDKGAFSQETTFGNFFQDTIIKYEPGKNLKYGIIAGIQRNVPIENTSFISYIGVDFIYMMNDFVQTGSGAIESGNGVKDSFSTPGMLISISSKNKLKTYGIGVPIGITYRFAQKFYTSIEAKFVVTYQKSNDYMFSETIQNFGGQEFIVKNEINNSHEGFDFGIKPLTGLCIGMFF